MSSCRKSIQSASNQPFPHQWMMNQLLKIDLHPLWATSEVIKNREKVLPHRYRARQVAKVQLTLCRRPQLIPAQSSVHSWLAVTVNSRYSSIHPNSTGSIAMEASLQASLGPKTTKMRSLTTVLYWTSGLVYRAIGEKACCYWHKMKITLSKRFHNVLQRHICLTNKNITRCNH